MERSSQLFSNPNSIDNQSSVTNSTAVAITPLVYVFAPADFSIELVFVVLFVIFGVIGLVGNILILYFLSKKKVSSFPAVFSFPKKLQSLHEEFSFFRDTHFFHWRCFSLYRTNV